MEIYVVILLLMLKENGDLSEKIKPLLKVILDNKELLSLYLSEPKKQEPPPETEHIPSALLDFLDRYVR